MAPHPQRIHLTWFKPIGAPDARGCQVVRMKQPWRPMTRSYAFQIHNQLTRGGMYKVGLFMDGELRERVHTELARVIAKYRRKCGIACRLPVAPDGDPILYFWLRPEETAVYNSAGQLRPFTDIFHAQALLMQVDGIRIFRSQHALRLQVRAVRLYDMRLALLSPLPARPAGPTFATATALTQSAVTAAQTQRRASETLPASPAASWAPLVPLARPPRPGRARHSASPPLSPAPPLLTGTGWPGLTRPGEGRYVQRARLASVRSTPDSLVADADVSVLPAFEEESIVLDRHVELECVICLSAVPNAQLLPCRHVVCCWPCSQKAFSPRPQGYGYERCVKCRRVVQKILHIPS